MRSPELLAFLGLGAGLVLLASGLTPVENELSAGGGGLAILADRDGDGLDDALEVRIGTNPDEVDSDFDECSDLEEYVAGEDPLFPSSQFSNPQPTIKIAGYMVGTDFILSVFALRQQRTAKTWVHVGNENTLHSFRPNQLGAHVVDSAALEATSDQLEGWTIERMRIHVPKGWLRVRRSTSFAIEALVDDLRLVDTFHVVRVGSVPAEFRFDQIGRSSGPVSGASSNANSQLPGTKNNSKATGFASLKPLEPQGEGAPAQGESGKACSQLVQAVGNLGDGRIVWEVVNAECIEVDQTPPAVCMTGCEATVGDEFTTIDVVGLLGN